jgi:hypothetical protein
VKARLAVLGALVTLALATMASAHAGGSPWNLDRESYEAGDVAIARGDFGPGCCDRGWLENGPYVAWVVPYRDGVASIEPEIPGNAVRVGEVHISQEPFPSNTTYLVNVASAEFVVPDLPPGPYFLVHCNDPCTAALGDLLWGFFWIGPPGDLAALTPTTTTTTTIPTTRAPSTTTAARRPEPPTSTSTTTTTPVVAGGLVATAGVATAGALGWRRRRRR